MKSAGKARSNGLYRHIRTSKEIIRNLLNYLPKHINFMYFLHKKVENLTEKLYNIRQDK